MKDSNDFSLVQLRESIFVQKDEWKLGEISDINRKLLGYAFGVIPRNIPSKRGMFPVDFVLSSLNERTRILFSVQKVDCIIETESKDIMRSLNDLNKRCTEILLDVLEITGTKTASRLAVAPLFRYNSNTALQEKFVETIYAKSKLKFKNEKIDNCEFSQLFRVNEGINGRKIKINYLSRFYVENIFTRNEKPRLCNMAVFDINTLPDPEYNFDVDFVKNFFLKSPVFCEDFLSYYFNNGQENK